MQINYYRIRLPSPFDQERKSLKTIYYVVAIINAILLIVLTLLELGMMAA